MQPDFSGQRTRKNTFVAPDNGQIKRLSKISFPGFILDASYTVFVSLGSGNRFIGETGNPYIFRPIYCDTTTSNRHLEARNRTRTIRLLAFARHLLARSWPFQATLKPSRGYLMAT